MRGLPDRSSVRDAAARRDPELILGAALAAAEIPIFVFGHGCGAARGSEALRLGVGISCTDRRILAGREARIGLDPTSNDTGSARGSTCGA
jgi:hypothetical protein